MFLFIFLVVASGFMSGCFLEYLLHLYYVKVSFINIETLKDLVKMKLHRR